MNSAWLVGLGTNPDAKTRLFCFPFAGGSASAYHEWRRLLPGLEICAVQLPGRENRVKETPVPILSELIAQLADALTPQLSGKPFGFFGHSLGGLIAFELARELRNREIALPARLIISARQAPGIPNALPKIHDQKEDEKFIEELAMYGGLDMDLLRVPSFRRVFLPMLRADFALFENYEYQPGKPLSCPITALAGVSDEIVPPDSLAGWKDHTEASADFELLRFEGGHFYLRDRADELTRVVADRLNRRSE
jgi:surfactin synthase thioesterase subunit